jgi:hypothetical protein
MFCVKEVSEVGCCSDFECSGVGPDDKVFVIVDTETNTPIIVEDFGISGLYQTGTYLGKIGPGSMYREQAEQAMQELIAFFS